MAISSENIEHIGQAVVPQTAASDKGVAIKKIEAASQATINNRPRESVTTDSLLRKISGLEISISIDDESLPPVVRIFDKSSGSEIVQIPTSTSLAIQKSVDRLIGVIFDKKA